VFYIITIASVAPAARSVREFVPRVVAHLTRLLLPFVGRSSINRREFVTIVIHLQNRDITQKN